MWPLQVQEISFQKVALLFGAGQAVEDRSNGNKGGATQIASALAALSSAFNPSSASKISTPKPSRTGQGSQRAAAVAALSSVLTAEKKKQSPDVSPAKSSSSTPAVTSPPPETKSEVDSSELEESRFLKPRRLVYLKTMGRILNQSKRVSLTRMGVEPLKVLSVTSN
ncbi:villin-2-like [Hibiscus syriacus]|uniref:villin-2-like n=1 Tax=Hibiscus syriacus TaxID=106335 RepID=UPI0019245F3C|nr:villin-2-like [Hibiscus syriacus]